MKRPVTPPPERESQAGILNVVDALVIVLDPAGHIMSFNRACEELSGYTFAEVRGRLVWEILLPPDEVELVRERVRRAAAGDAPVRGENHWLTRSGALRWIVWSNAVLRGTTGAAARVVATGIDVSDLRAASERVRESEDRYRALLEHASDGMVFTDEDLQIVDVNPRACEMLGYARAELLRMSARDLPDPENVAAHPLEIERWNRKQSAFTRRSLRRRDGSVFIAETHTSRFPDGRILAIFHDITERERAERALRESEERFRRVFESDMMGMIFGLHGGAVADANDYFLRLLGFTRDDLVAGRVRWNVISPPEFAARVERAVREAHEAGISRPFETEFIRRDGTRVPVLCGAAFIGEAHDFGVGFALDLTELRRTTRRLAESELYLERAQELAHVGTWDADLSTMTATFSDEMVRIYGRPPGSHAVTYAEFIASIHPDDRLSVQQIIRTVIERPGQQKFEHRIVRPDGAVRVVEATSESVLDASGRPQRIIGSVQDITERRLLELQLREAQRLESIGRLAGGVAHDFNNLLTVILGFTETLLEGLPAGDARRANAEQIRGAGRRAADLTQQLLAFGRRQVFRMQVLDLNAVLVEMRDILQRLVGGQIEIAISPDARQSLVRADRGQVEQVILNLVLNARDAMPAGGRLGLVTRDVEPSVGEQASPAGRWLQLAVSDTGTGMSPEVQAHIFEPFFSTKQVGQGTGLGLATVHGIVTQTGGRIEVNSDSGEGTTFRVFLPCAADEASREEAASTPVSFESRGEETVLLVEDESAVRGFIAEALRRQGYLVIEAADGDQAIDTAHGHAGVIHLLVTDLAMPGMTGRELARFLIHERPGLRVLFISGYSDQRAEPRGSEGGPEAFLQKPFTSLVLARQVRQVLDAPGPGPTPG
jgi:PAS domain S-box-containing protein